MRFLSMIRLDENTGQVPSEQLMQDMGKLMDEMTREGVLVRTAGLRPTREGKRVQLRQGKLSIVDGPFTETKELVAGFSIIKADSLEEAIELVKRAPNGEGIVEIRKLMDIEDFGEGFTPNAEIAKVKYR